MPTGMTIPGVDMFGYKAGFNADRPWLFEDMDVIKFHEVSTEDYDKAMAQFKSGNYHFQYTESTFDMAHHNKLLKDTEDEVKKLRDQRAVAQERMNQHEKKLFTQWTEEKKASEVDLDSVNSLLEGMYHCNCQGSSLHFAQIPTWSLLKHRSMRTCGRSRRWKARSYNQMERLPFSKP
jgi:hypothetical protein